MAVTKFSVDNCGSTVDAVVIGVECEIGNTVGTVVVVLERDTVVATGVEYEVGTAGSLHLVLLVRGTVLGISTTLIS